MGCNNLNYSQCPRLHKYLRASIGRDHLASLALMHIHYDKEVNLELVDLSTKLVVCKVGVLAQQFEGLYYYLVFQYAPITPKTNCHHYQKTCSRD